MKSIIVADSLITENGYGIYQSNGKTAKTLSLNQKDNCTAENNHILGLPDMVRLWIILNDINSENFLEKIKKMTITSTIGVFPQSFQNGNQLLDIKPSTQDDYLIYIEGKPDIAGIEMKMYFATNAIQHYYKTYITFIEFRSKIIELFHCQNDAPILSELGISLPDIHDFNFSLLDGRFVLNLMKK